MSSTSQAIQPLVIHYVLVLELALLQELSGAGASNSFTSFPPQVNGSITACVGDEISLTCSRSDSGPALTNWTFSLPINCSSEVSHNSQAADPPQCGPFTFINISALGVANFVNSTAVGTASSEINGSKIECMFGITTPVSVGNTSLCITDTLPAPVNLRCMDSEVARRLLVTWDVVTDGSSACARSSIVHDVTVKREDDGMIIFSMNNVKTTRIEVTDSLETGQNYSIRVGTKLIHGTCETDEAIICRTSDDLSPTTAPTTTAPPVSSDDEGMTTIGPATQNGSPVSAAVVAVPIVLILGVAAVVIIILIIFGYIYYRRHSELPCNLTRMLRDKNFSHVYELTHTPAPGGDLYTDISKAPSKSKHHEAQQDNTHNGFSDESKDPDVHVKTDIAPREDDIPPPKPKRMSKAESKAESETKSETKDNEKASKPPLSDPGYEDLDNFKSS